MALPRPPSVENVSTTLSTSATDAATTLTVSNASNLVAPCYLVVDRVDSSGALKSVSLWEYIKVTNVSGNDLTVTRGVNGSTAQSHSSGAVVEAVITSAHFEDWYTALSAEHTDAGGHVIGTATVTTHLHIVSGASISGLRLNPTFFVSGNISGATVGVGKPLIVPRPSTLAWWSVVTRTVASGASIVFDVRKNGTSIFAGVTAPTIVGGGTFVSTASIATKNLDAGNILTADVKTFAAGGHITDFTIQGG